MKRYKPRPGVVHTQICGVHVLIPSREAYPDCAQIQRLPMLWVIIWDVLCGKTDLEKAMQIHRILTKRPDEEIMERIDRFCSVLCEKGFLIEEPDESEAPSEPDARTTRTEQEELP